MTYNSYSDSAVLINCMKSIKLKPPQLVCGLKYYLCFTKQQSYDCEKHLCFYSQGMVLPIMDNKVLMVLQTLVDMEPQLVMLEDMEVPHLQEDMDHLQVIIPGLLLLDILVPHQVGSI